MTLDEETLRRITALTIAHYNDNAQSFRAGTQDHDVSQNIAALLRHIEGPPPYTLLDLGCGPGRDLKTFSALGHRAIGLDGAEHFVEMARASSGCEVLQQNLLDLALPDSYFDGIFANAVLFHVPVQELPRVLRQLRASLKPRGVLFSSNPHGQNQEGWNGPRYGSYHDLSSWQALLAAAGFDELEHYYRPAGLPRAQQPWLASVWRRREDEGVAPA
ncbi:methyltransferase domain-containing protein [Pusillimonas sp. TS35]|uniref:class I SAM-dependent methyltransferase n=1 Tax=Paracandidimonas lactea TaxID=2895524 RepID=UPI001369F32F|nr:class I SAM-dependent methyltransferase [Paracandidimonas lactea]MYN13553.1 methyltransferase domain-containing protein [Pusillimonas sp. TS35]